MPKNPQKVVFFTKAEKWHAKNRDYSLGWVLSVVFVGLHMPSASFLPRGTPTITVLSLQQYSYLAPIFFAPRIFFSHACLLAEEYTLFIPHGCFPPDHW